MFVCHHLIHNPSGKHIQNCHLCLNMSARNYSLMDHHIHLYLKKMLNSFIRAKSFAATNTAWKVSVFRVFVVCIFSHSDWIRRDTEYLSVFSPNAGKYSPAKTPYLDTFHAVLTLATHVFLKMNRLGIHFFYRTKWSFLGKDISTNYNTFYCFKKLIAKMKP